MIVLCEWAWAFCSLGWVRILSFGVGPFFLSVPGCFLLPIVPCHDYLIQHVWIVLITIAAVKKVKGECVSLSTLLPASKHNDIT